MVVFWIQNTKLIFYLLPKINHGSREFSIQREFEFNREGERRKAEETTRIGMNYSRHLLGSSHPIDRFLSYFKGDAILHEEKSWNFSSRWYFSYSYSNWDDRMRSERVRNFTSSQFQTIVLYCQTFFYNKLHHPVFSKMRIFFMRLKKIIWTGDKIILHSSFRNFDLNLTRNIRCNDQLFHYKWKSIKIAKRNL